MACLKCGKKTKDEQVFCTECLEVMEAYPVKRDIHIQLPTRPDASVQKRAARKRRNLTPEEQALLYRAKTRRLTVVVVLLILLLLVAVAGILYYSGQVDKLIKFGANYTHGGS